jgi:hypothetical protein
VALTFFLYFHLIAINSSRLHKDTHRIQYIVVVIVVVIIIIIIIVIVIIIIIIYNSNAGKFSF